MHEPFPRLLIVTDLVRPLNLGANTLGRLVADLATDVPPTLIQGALVMAVATTEVALADSLKYYLRHFPEKVPRDHLRNAADALRAEADDLVSASTERYTVALAYKSFPEYLAHLEKILSIDIAIAYPYEVASVREVKATRNLLLHNALVVNDAYLEQAGDKRRATDIGDRLTVDRIYVARAIPALSVLVKGLAATLSKKYAAYTKLAAHRRLWAYLFKSPVMPYEDFWEVDESTDRIVAMKQGESKARLSSTELIFLGLWRAHFGGSDQYLTEFNMRRFDRWNLRRLHFLLRVARSFPWE